MRAVGELKECSKCFEIKNIIKFNKDTTNLDGLCVRCKSCDSIKLRNYHENHRSETATYERKWRQTNPDSAADTHRKKMYNISGGQFRAQLMAQNNVCAICCEPETYVLFGKIKKMSVDHNRSCCSGDKSCGKCIRGLICNKCNHALGLVNDEIPILRGMLTYLELEGYQKPANLALIESPNLRIKNYLTIYGLDYKFLFIEQNGDCKICKNPEKTTRFGRTLSLAVDHCKKTGKIRGLLCGNCNRALGLVEDNPLTIKSMINYLENFKERK